MPELPEVEVTRLSFAERIAGARIESVWLGKPLRWPLGCSAQTLLGRRVLALRRRGKYLLLDLDVGLLLLHLGMSGRLRFDLSLPARGAHDHFELATSQGLLRLTDPRRFGAVVYADSEQAAVAQKLLGRLGVEPLTDDFRLADWQRQLKTRKAPIKQVLLAGELVVGVGNIYASEALFQAGIRPTVSAARLSRARAARLRADRISRPRATRLLAALRSTLARALALGGSTLRDFHDAHGMSGAFQTQAAVYGRAGQPCTACGHVVRRIVQAQRSTFLCPQCQRR